MRKKIKEIQFINEETNEKEIIWFSAQNNIIIGPKGGGKSKLLNILAAAILGNNDNNKIEIPCETLNALKKYKLKLNYISFYDDKKISEDKIQPIDYETSYPDSKKIKEEIIREKKELEAIINNKKNIVLQDDNIKNDIFYSVDNDFQKKYLKYFVEDNKNKDINLYKMFDYFKNISDQIFELSKIIFLNDESYLSPEWSDIKYISVDINSENELNNILSLLDIKNFKNLEGETTKLFSLEKYTLIDSEKVENLKKILKNDKSSNPVLLKMLKKEENENINKKIKSLEELNTDIQNLTDIIYSKAFLLNRIINKFCFSFSKMEEKATSSSNENSDGYKKEAYIKNSKNFFSHIANILFNIKNNIYKYMFFIDDLKLETKKICDLSNDKNDKKENSFLIYGDISLELNINSNFKLEVEKFLVQEIFSLKSQENENITLIIRNFLTKSKKGKGTYNANFRSYKKKEKKDIEKKFIDKYWENVRFIVKEIKTSEIKPYSQLSLGEKSIYGLIFSINKFSEDVMLIDQPEDNLDNQTISEFIINKLKERNNNNLQTFIVTHNANIGILSNDLNTECSVIMADIHNKEKKYSYLKNPWNEKDINNQAINYLEGSKQNLEERYKRLLRDKIDKNIKD